MTIVSVAAATTATSAAANANEVDISGIAATVDWTLKVEVRNLVGKARLQFEDTVNNFSAAIAGPVINVAGPLTKEAPQTFSFKKRDFPSLRFGTTSAEFRANLTEITGTDATITYVAWLEY